MHKATQKLLTRVAVVVAMATLLSGCNSQPTKKLTCTPPQGNKLAEAFVNARSELMHSACQYEFNNYESALMRIAKGTPDKENQQLFFDFYSWSAEQGVITKSQAKVRYTRYFSPSYGASLPDSYSNCASGTRLDGILSSLKREAKDKRLGLQEVMGDRDAWFDAKSRHDNLVFILETTALACEDQHRG